MNLEINTAMTSTGRKEGKQCNTEKRKEGQDGTCFEGWEMCL